MVYMTLVLWRQRSHDSVSNTATKLIYLLDVKMQFWIRILLGGHKVGIIDSIDNLTSLSKPEITCRLSCRILSTIIISKFRHFMKCRDMAYPSATQLVLIS